MWATCCNWFCLDGQPEEAPPPQGARTQAYSNPGYSSFPSPTGSEPNCKACGAHFASMARKQTCLDCKKNFCVACSSQVGSGPRLCLLCQRFRATAFQREELMKMKVKDLRDYLSLHDISTDMCREKEELVFLVLGQQPVISQEGRTHAPSLSPDSPEQQAFLTQPHTSTVPPTSPGLPSSPPAQARDRQQANGHVSQDQEEPVYLESTARAPAEDETQSVDSEDSFVPGRRASLSDLTDLEDIEGLTVRQLKEILARNFVNYKGCCEKWELMERVTRLYKDQKGLQHLVLASEASEKDIVLMQYPSCLAVLFMAKQWNLSKTRPDTPAGAVLCGAEDQNGGAVPSSLEENLCRICMDSPIDCVLLECGHMVTCTKCGKRMNECPICRQYVIRAVHVFRS
ncbi:E3 ubiquitin-protein ligase rififylin isoform X1 [Delphinapterus leucas]|nr:E3 ubiquitin-protein ligase rififylin isoform X1 [Delphinapterus leucas]XP_022422104.1 E3 ubiquitin-protein ligase rififylin isoform X1 [Delphinapterus leucas]XP_022422105.1 E3 ubiquitin-protein ligase rififylin isoform X1 [Delphinapterus leucas]